MIRTRRLTIITRAESELSIFSLVSRYWAGVYYKSWICQPFLVDHLALIPTLKDGEVKNWVQIAPQNRIQVKFLGGIISIVESVLRGKTIHTSQYD